MNPFTPPNGHFTLNLGGKPAVFSRPAVMGILNVTPDSFHAASRLDSPRRAVERAAQMLAQGADILDVGACSTRPGAEPASEDEERSRLFPVLEALRGEWPEAIISVDTFRASVAREAVERYGADIINDISFLADPEMGDVVAETKAPYVLTHNGAAPRGAAGVVSEMAFKLDALRDRGVADVIADPGFGFDKTIDENYNIMRNLEAFASLECPILVGVSRKRMTRLAPGTTVEGSLPATVALNAVALMKGASIIRVHDVEAAVQNVSIHLKLRSGEGKRNLKIW